MKADIAKYSVTVAVNGSDQRFSIKKNEITNLKVKSKKYNANKTKATVKSVITIEKLLL